MPRWGGKAKMRVSCSIDRDLYDFLSIARVSPSAVLEKATRNLMIRQETEAAARVVVEARPEDDVGPKGTDEAASYGQWFAANERIAKAIAPQERFKLWREETEPPEAKEAVGPRNESKEV